MLEHNKHPLHVIQYFTLNIFMLSVFHSDLMIICICVLVCVCASMCILVCAPISCVCNKTPDNSGLT